MPKTKHTKDSEPVKLFVLDHNQVISDLTQTMNLTDFENADVVLLWTDTMPMNRGIINLARAKGKKVFTIQHGRRGSSRYYEPFKEKLYADKHLVWGQRDKDALVEAGHRAKQIEVIGTTIFNRLKPRKRHEGINIVFSPEHWDCPVDENIQVRDELRKLPHNIITKIIDSPSHDGIKWDNPVKSNRGDYEHLDICADVLSTADLVVSVSESTFELLAQALDIPVVVMNEWEPKAFGGDERYVSYRRVVSEASKLADMKSLTRIVGNVLKNPEKLKNERKTVLEEEGGLSVDTLKVFKELCRK